MRGCWGGCCTRTCYLSEEERRAIVKHKDIERMLAEQKRRERAEVKLLLLGTGESGKTTFIKQMRIIHGNGFSKEQRRAYAKLVFQNIFTVMKALAEAMTTLRIPYANPQNEIYGQQFQALEINQMTHLDRMYVQAIHRLWSDAGIQLCYSRRREYQLLDSTEYYMTNIDRIAAADYIPTAQDVLRVRFPTTGINDYSFSVGKITLRIVDVGGQKSERKKWIHCFENVTSLIFLASLSEYDQVLEENYTENRMKESLALFYTTINSPWFTNSSIILFLNKMDILEEKIQTSDIQVYFPDFRGKRKDSEEAKKYICEEYKQQAINEEDVYSHFTCATDTNNIRMVFNDVKKTVLKASLQEYGILQ